jgi:hypothetical protein
MTRAEIVQKAKNLALLFDKILIFTSVVHRILNAIIGYRIRIAASIHQIV